MSNSREDPRDWAVAPPQNWAEELDCCLDVFGHEYAAGSAESVAFRRGMKEVFRHLTAVLPPIEQCKAAVQSFPDATPEATAVDPPRSTIPDKWPESDPHH